MLSFGVIHSEGEESSCAFIKDDLQGDTTSKLDFCPFSEM